MCTAIWSPSKSALTRCRLAMLNADGLASTGSVQTPECLGGAAWERDEQHGMLAADILECPTQRGPAVRPISVGLLIVVVSGLGFELVIDERLEELESHFPWQPHWFTVYFRATTIGASGISPRPCPRRFLGGNVPFLCPLACGVAVVPVLFSYFWWRSTTATRAPLSNSRVDGFPGACAFRWRTMTSAREAPSASSRLRLMTRR